MLVALLVVLALVALASIVVSAMVISGNREAAAARATFAESLSDGDLDTAAATAATHPDVLETPHRLDLDEPFAIAVGDTGVGVARVRLEAGTEYVVALDGGTSAVLFGPAGDAPEPVDGTVVPEQDGVHTVALVGEAGEEVTTTVGPVPVVEIDLTEPVEGDLAPGGVVDHSFEVFADHHYYIEEFTGAGLSVRFLDDEGREIETYVDQDGDVRFEATVDGDVRARVQGDSATAGGAFALDVVRLATHYAYYGTEGDEAYIPDQTEASTVVPTVDTTRDALSFCLWVRSGVTVELDVVPTTAGTSWDLYTYAEEGAPVDDELDQFTDVTTSTITLQPADADQVWCFDVVPTDDDPDGVVEVGITTIL